MGTFYTGLKDRGPCPDPKNTKLAESLGFLLPSVLYLIRLGSGATGYFKVMQAYIFAFKNSLNKYF